MAATDDFAIGRAEPCVAATIDNVLELASRACGAAVPARPVGL